MLFQGCDSYKYSLVNYSTNETGVTLFSKYQPECQPLYQIIPRHRSQLHWHDFGKVIAWMVFGNDDDGIFGEGPDANYRPDQAPNFSKALAWWLRNPFHNLCFYVIGSAHRRNSQIILFQIVDNKISGLQYRPCGTVFLGKEGFSFHVALHGGKPFIALRFCYHKRYRADFYIGWRERGNFGIKILPFCKRR